jgi:hypothetical protein
VPSPSPEGAGAALKAPGFFMSRQRCALGFRAVRRVRSENPRVDVTRPLTLSQAAMTTQQAGQAEEGRRAALTYATDMPREEVKLGRDGRIRTADLLTPSQAR